MSFIEKHNIEFDTDTLSKRIKELAVRISNDYNGQELTMIGVLKGSFYFFADLTRQVDIPIQIDFISIGLYPHTTSETGVVRIIKDLDLDITGRHVLIIEDIVRTGLTLGYLVQNLESRKPASVKICTLLLNAEQQLINLPIAYKGFDITDRWLAGYGMDINESGRNLPYIIKADKNVPINKPK